jgi:hypothetical protein
MDKRREWKFIATKRRTWRWTVTFADGKQLVSAQEFVNLTACVCNAAQHGYVACKCEDDRRADYGRRFA